MKAKSIDYQNPEHHGFLWYCFESLFNKQKFLEEMSMNGWGFFRHGKKVLKKGDGKLLDPFNDSEELDQYMRALEEDR